MKVFKDALVYLDGKIKRVDLQFGERIAGFGSEGERIALSENAVVFPGFIDEHVHGAGGADAMDGSVGALSVIAQTLAAEGTTGFLATTMTDDGAKIARAMNAVKEYRQTDPGEGAEVLGVHLEGPFISPEYKGAQNENYVCKPDSAVFGEWQKASGNAIKLVTLAPEADGAEELIDDLVKKGIVVSIGHTSATHEQIERAIGAGAGNVTHTFNAMSPLHHREIGAVGSALLHDELNCELIADGIHVSVPAMRLLFKSKPKGKITLITDAIRAKGLGDGESELGGQKVFVRKGQARLADGTLAGSVLQMNKAIKRLIKEVGVSVSEAINAATITPARTLGIDKDCGSIEIGKKANFAILDPDFNVISTYRNGKVIFRN